MGALWGVFKPGGGLSSSIFHGFSPFRSAASHTRLTGPFSFISKHLSQTRRARGFGRLRQEVAATQVRGDTRVFFLSVSSDCSADRGAVLLF